MPCVKIGIAKRRLGRRPEPAVIGHMPEGLLEELGRKSTLQGEVDTQQLTRVRPRRSLGTGLATVVSAKVIGAQCFAVGLVTSLEHAPTPTNGVVGPTLLEG